MFLCFLLGGATSISLLVARDIYKENKDLEEKVNKYQKLYGNINYLEEESIENEDLCTESNNE